MELVGKMQFRPGLRVPTTHVVVPGTRDESGPWASPPICLSARARPARSADGRHRKFRVA